MNPLYNKAFCRLPLSPEQVRAIEHYIRACERSSVPWDTPELTAMLKSMLYPPETVEDVESVIHEYLTAEQMVANNEESDRFDLLKSERDGNH